MWKKYAVIYKRSKRFSYKDRLLIKQGCTIDDPEPEYMKANSDIEEAKKLVERLGSIIHDYGHHLIVIEYMCEVWQHDENGNVEFTGDIESISEMKIRLVTDPGYETYGTYDNLEDAERAKMKYDGDENLYISFI